MNRFLVNLCSLDVSGPPRSASQETSRFSTLNFTVPDSVLGNIGQPLAHGASYSEEYGETTLEERDMEMATNAGFQAGGPIAGPFYLEQS